MICIIRLKARLHGADFTMLAEVFHRGTEREKQAIGCLHMASILHVSLNILLARD